MQADTPRLPTDDAHHAALLELGDRLRNLHDPTEMAFVAAEIMGRVLQVSRAGYGTIDASAGTIDMDRDWTAPGVPSLSGEQRFICCGSMIEHLGRGEPVVFEDVTQDPRAAMSRETWARIGIRAVLNYPIFEHGIFVAVFHLHDVHPRKWTAEELDFVRNVADRTRAAIQRRHAEDALRDLAASLERQVAERTADRNRLWRLSGDIMLVARLDGVITAVNPAWTTVLGWRERELVGKNLITLVHPDDEERTRAGALRLSGGKALRRFDNRHLHKDGSYRWISWTAVASDDVISAVGRDVTVEKAQTEALERSEALMRSAFESSYQYQGFVTPEGIVLDANPVSLAGIKAGLEDVVGKPFWDTPWFTGTAGVPEQIKAAFPDVVAGKTFRREVTVELPTGARAFDFSLRPVVNGTGGVLAVIVEALELTERRAAEEQLRHAQKMEAVGQLTGGLAHDFNNLLTGIAGSLELLKDRFAQGRFAGAERYVKTAIGAANRATALTQRLLAFSRRQMLEPRPTQANELISDMKDLIQRTVGPAIRVEAIPFPDLWTTLCDQHQLENAVLNLCINARDAMIGGGCLTIETANTTFEEREIYAGELLPGDYVTICVTDTGSGMSSEIVSRAFDPFFTTKPIGKGTGLGLSMVYGFVKQSGGNVVIASTVGRGTTVKIHMPRYQGPALEEEPAAVPIDVPRANDGECVMIVDDEPSVRMLAKDVLEALGYSAIEAKEASTSLEVLQSPTRIDLLVTDVGLPGYMNGRQLADAARELRPDLKILFITGYAENVAFGSDTLAPGMEVMTKPFSMEAFAAKIRTMIPQA
ncbi:MAG TPA: PAS domain S-box protein [Aliidongia sp.]|nr:PAS domain S-box protein [Aliidongia sp.]